MIIIKAYEQSTYSSVTSTVRHPLVDSVPSPS